MKHNKVVYKDKNVLLESDIDLEGMRFRRVSWPDLTPDAYVVRELDDDFPYRRWLTDGGANGRCKDSYRFLTQILMGDEKMWYATALPHQLITKEIEF
jgi:hypothetical protein